MEAFKVLVIEDDAGVRGLVRKELEAWGLEVIAPALEASSASGEPTDPLASFAEAGPHLVVLDIGLPRFDGFELCRRIREFSRVPILFLTARTGAADMVRGLAEGGDDWLSKPFDAELLVAKARALLRRAYDWATERTPLVSRGSLVFDRDRGIASKGGRTISLGKNEAALLRSLLERDGRVASRGDLMDALWSQDEFVDDNTLTVNVTRLKKSLSEIGSGDMIETVRGAGYRIR